MRKKILGFVFAAALLAALAVPLFGGGTAFAHNVGHVDTPVGCADVGGGNAPPEGNAVGNGGHPRGIHHAIHAGPQDKSAVESGSC